MAEILAFIRRDVLILRSYPAQLYTPFVSAVIAVASFAYIARLVDPHSPLREGGHAVPYMTYVVINLAFMLLLTTAFNSLATSLRRDQLTGTLQAMFTTGASSTLIVLGSMVWPMLFGTIQAVCYLALGIAFGMRLENCNVPMLIMFAFLGPACMSLLGIIAGAVVIRFRQSAPTSFIIGNGAALLAGVLFPIRLLPIPLQMLSWLLPTSHALSGFRAAVLGAPAQAMLGDAAWLGAATLVLLPTAFVLFARALEVAKFDGTLASY